MPLEAYRLVRTDRAESAFNGEGSRLFGGRWNPKGVAVVQEARSALLEVPSAVLPQERNYVLNPQHRDFGQLHVERALPIRLDERLWR
jgi:RES domain-containing protein